MRKLAIKYLDFDAAAVDNVDWSRPGDPSAFKFDILHKWACIPGNNSEVIICRLCKLCDNPRDIWSLFPLSNYNIANITCCHSTNPCVCDNVLTFTHWQQNPSNDATV